MVRLAGRGLVGFAGLFFLACGGNSYERSDSHDDGGSSGSATGGSGGAAPSGGAGPAGGAAPSGGAGPAGGAGPSGGAGAAGPARPERSASCTLRHPPSDLTTEVSWNAETRTFTIGSIYWKLDANFWVTGKAEESGQWSHSMEYDELGTMSSFTYIWEGGESPMNSWDQTNVYEGGALISFSRFHRSGDRFVSQRREYSQGLLARLTEDQLTSGNAAARTMEFLRDGELVSVVRQETGGQLISTATAVYDGTHLSVLDMDGTGFTIADGTPDIRQRWEYDEAGRVIRFEQDGTTVLDNPQIDGVPDETIIFEPACAEIAVLPEQLYRFPNWLAPRPGSGTGF